MPIVLVQQFHKVEDKFQKTGEPNELDVTDDERAQLERAAEVVYLGSLDGYFALAAGEE